MNHPPANVSIGIAAAAGPDVAAALAPRMEALGFAGLWVNDTPGHDALPVLAAAANASAHLRLATGVLPIDRRAPVDIIGECRELGLDPARFIAGIGSGGLRNGALAAVADAASTLTSFTPDVMIGALGPRMRRLAAESARGPLLSWLTPSAADIQAQDARSRSAGTHVALYVRTAMDAAAVPRMNDEADRYASFPTYAANFARLGFTARDTCVVPETATRKIEDYRGVVDEVVLRAITADDRVTSYLDFVECAAAML